MSPDEYREHMEKFFEVGMAEHLGLEKPVTLLTIHSEKYPVGGGKALTDGLKGTDDYHCNWLGFEANEMEAVIDLQKEMDIRLISADFLQDHNSWIWMPKKVEFFVSNDGVSFKKVGEADVKSDEKKSGAFTENFKCEFQNIKARYVKIQTSSLLYCPDWHKGAGGKSWIFCDEIIVK